MPILHYIYDPLCGWCYGAAPLLEAARQVIEVQAHGGGMMAGANRQRVTPQLRAYVAVHDARIAQLTGQRFGSAYVDGLLNDTDVVLDSEPPTAAVLAAQAFFGRGLDMLKQLQVAHYVEGRRIADRTTLIELATEMGLDSDTFSKALDDQCGQEVQHHIDRTRLLMRDVGANGFPALVLETDGAMHRIDISGYLGEPQAFQDWLRNRGTGSAEHTESQICGIDGCAN